MNWGNNHDYQHYSADAANRRADRMTRAVLIVLGLCVIALLIWSECP